MKSGQIMVVNSGQVRQDRTLVAFALYTFLGDSTLDVPSNSLRLDAFSSRNAERQVNMTSIR